MHLVVRARSSRASGRETMDPLPTKARQKNALGLSKTIRLAVAVKL
jgi:hypothetical protein